MKRLIVFALVSVVVGACGEPQAKLTINLETSSMDALDPFKSSVGLSRVRVSVKGPERFDDASVDVSLQGRTAVFETFPGERRVDVTVSGFDQRGTLLAFGRVESVNIDGDQTITVPFRRMLAYVTHRAICDGGCRTGQACVDLGGGFECRPTSTACGACEANLVCTEETVSAGCFPRYAGTGQGPSQVYVLDLVTRALVQKVPLPGAGAKARFVSAREGRGVVVAYTAANKGYVGFLDADDHTWKSVELSRPADIAVIGRGSVGAAVGGGMVSLFDIDTGMVLSEKLVGGRGLDGGVGDRGRKALFVISASPGVIMVDLERPDEPVTPPGMVVSASGVAMSEDRRVAFVTSSGSADVVTVEMATGALSVLGGSFSGAVENAVYSDRSLTVLAIQRNPAENISRVLSYSVLGRDGLGLANSVGTLSEPSGIAAGPGGRRIIVVSAGTSTRSAGLTVIDTDLDLGPDGSTTRYPLDPDDTFVTPEGFTERQRYRPHKVAVLYGR